MPPQVTAVVVLAMAALVCPTTVLGDTEGTAQLYVKPLGD